MWCSVVDGMCMIYIYIYVYLQGCYYLRMEIEQSTYIASSIMIGHVNLFIQ